MNLSDSFARRAAWLFVTLFLAVCSANAQTTAFTYQGKLSDTAPTNMVYDFRFDLYAAESGGVPINSVPITVENVVTTNGVFTVQLNFVEANAFPAGENRFLQIRIRRGNETGGFTELEPRQLITSSPYSIRSISATNATNAINATNATNATTAQNVSGVVAIANGGTGSTTQNFVDLTAAQTIAGNKTFSNPVNTTTQYNIGGNRVLLSSGVTSNLYVGVDAGASNGTGNNNSFVGTSAGFTNTTGTYGSFFGFEAGRFNANGFANSFFGAFAGYTNIGGGYNSFFGADAGINNQTGNNNSFFGLDSGRGNTTGNNNTFVGYYAGERNTTGGNNTIIGKDADVGSTTTNLNFATAIGSHAVVSGNDTIVIGKVAGTYNSVARPADIVRIPGGLAVTGNISKGGGSFKIDHPLDPQNKYLSHSFVESPDMMNVYNGNITTDAAGEATVTLPDYFQALNRDFRYQLTVIGQFAQVIVSEKVKGNQFKIKTDKPNVEVSWQVTGIRQDKFAEENRIPNEENKPADEIGKCLYIPACKPN